MIRQILIATVLVLSGCAGMGHHWQNEDITRAFKHDHAVCAKQATSILGFPPNKPHHRDARTQAIFARLAYEDYQREHAVYVKRCLGVMGWEWAEVRDEE